MKKILLVTAILAGLMVSSVSFARTNGFYLAGGYQQPIMFSWQKQGTATSDPSKSAKMWPGFGMFLLGGFQFEKPDWLGVAVPFSYNRVKVNGLEWGNMYSFGAEVTFHLLPKEQKLDFYIGPTFGYNLLTVKNLPTKTFYTGPEFGALAGLEYAVYERKVNNDQHVQALTLFLNVPFKISMFFNDQVITEKKTALFLSIPIRLGLAYHF